MDKVPAEDKDPAEGLVEVQKLPAQVVIASAQIAVSILPTSWVNHATRKNALIAVHR